jgi:hypothetical protein
MGDGVQRQDLSDTCLWISCQRRSSALQLLQGGNIEVSYPTLLPFFMSIYRVNPRACLFLFVLNEPSHYQSPQINGLQNPNFKSTVEISRLFNLEDSRRNGKIDSRKPPFTIPYPICTVGIT